MIEYYRCAYCNKTTETEDLFIGIDFSFRGICVCKEHKDQAGLYLDTTNDWKPHIMPKNAIIGKAGRL